MSRCAGWLLVCAFGCSSIGVDDAPPKDEGAAARERDPSKSVGTDSMSGEDASDPGAGPATSRPADEGRPAGSPSPLGQGPEPVYSPAAPSDDPDAPAVSPEVGHSGVGAFTRLTRREYDSTVFAAFGLRPDPSSIPEDGRVGVFTSNAGIAMDPVHAYLLAAEELAARVVPVVLPECSDDVGRCIETEYAPAMAVLFRRAVTPLELVAWTELVETSHRAGATPLEATRVLVGSLLLSPDFLYRSAPASVSVRQRVAERVAFALWDAPPTAQLLAGEDAWSEADTDVVIDDARSVETVARFLGQWLDVDLDLRRETAGFESSAEYLEWLELTRDALAEDRSVSSLLTSSFGFVHPDNAESYELDVVGQRAVRMPWPENSSRRGLLGQELIAASTRHPDSSRRVIFRGLLVRRGLLCDEVPAPSADLVALAGEVGERTEDSRCAGCHLRLDPIGQAFAAFDPEGEVLSAEVIGHAELDGSYADLGSLLQAVADSRAFAECFAKNWLGFFLELEPDEVDPAWQFDLADRVQAGASLREILLHSARGLYERHESFVPWCEVSQ